MTNNFAAKIRNNADAANDFWKINENTVGNVLLCFSLMIQESKDLLSDFKQDLCFSLKFLAVPNILPIFAGNRDFHPSLDPSLDLSHDPSYRLSSSLFSR